PGADSDIRPHAGRRTPPPPGPHPCARLVPRGRVDRHRLARDHGERRAQWQQRRGGGAPSTRPPARLPFPLSSAGGDPAGGGMTAIFRGAPPGPSSTAHRGETVIPAIDTADVAALLTRGRALTTPVLRSAVDRLAPPMDTVAAYHFGWIDA